MKKYFILIAIIGLVIAFLYDCDSISVKGADGTEYDSYQECCAANDYEAAHKFLSKLQNNRSRREYNEAKEYVFKNEALFLMSLDDETAQKRIIYLLKEEGGNNDHVSMLIDLAIENDDDLFVKTLANQYSKGVNQENLRKLKDYLLQKADSNYEFIYTLFKKIESNELLFETALQCKDYESIKELVADSLSLEREHLLNLLSGIKDNGISEQIVGLLTPLENDIPLRPRLGNSDINMVDGYVDYQNAVKNYNEHCLTLLNFAIKNGNQFLAERLMKKFKSNILYGLVKDGYRQSDGGYYRIINIKIDNSEINSAKSTYQEALRSGAFR